MWTAGVTFYFCSRPASLAGGTYVSPTSRRALVAALLAVVSVSAADGPVIKFTDTTLENGLRVIISEDHSAPVVSVAVYYDVGSPTSGRGAQGSLTCSST